MKLFKQIAKFVMAKLPVGLQCWFISIRSVGSKTKVGKGSYIHKSVHILGKEQVSLGSNSCISEGCWLNVNHRTESNKAIQIGNHCFIGKGNFFSSGRKIEIGDYSLTTIGCRFVGSSHHIDNPLQPYLTTGTTDTDSIVVGVNCFIGAGATVIGNVKIGHGSVIGANALVLSDVPPFSIAVGNPAKVIKRYSFMQDKWLNTNDFSESDEKEQLSESNYLKNLQSSHPRLNLPWIAAGRSLGNL